MTRVGYVMGGSVSGTVRDVCYVITAYYTITMSRTLKVTSNHVKFMPLKLLPVSEEAKT